MLVIDNCTRQTFILHHDIATIIRHIKSTPVFCFHWTGTLNSPAIHS